MEEQRSKKSVIIVVVALAALLAIGGGAYLFMKRGTSGSLANSVGKVLPFGEQPPDAQNGTITGGNGTETGNGSNAPGWAPSVDDPVFKKLSEKPVAGLFPVTHDGAQFVRYVDRETGHIFEVNVTSGESKELTNFTVPRIHEALWGLDGDAVILRYLEEDPYSKADIIKTSLGYLSLPTASSTDAIGTLIISNDNLPDNIIEVSVSPNGKKLLYMIKTLDGVSGSIVDLTTKLTREVFRNSYTEWLPELLDTDEILFTTKPSAQVPGFTYRYNINTKSFERILRNKNGLTSHANAEGGRILYAENALRNIVFGVYDKKGFSNEGDIEHESVLSLTTLPEKCAWRKDGIRMICGGFSFSPTFPIPDTWYQGAMTFNDTFWSVNTDKNESVFLYDPASEVKQSFDVIYPSLSSDEHYLIFVNKTDSLLWRMRLPDSLDHDTVNDTGVTLPPDLSPEELKDAQGTTP